MLSIRKARRTRLPSSCRDCIITSIPTLECSNTTQQHATTHTLPTHTVLNWTDSSQCCSQAHIIHQCRVSTTPPTRLFAHHHSANAPQMLVQGYSTSAWRYRIARTNQISRNARSKPILCCKRATRPRRGGETCSSSASRTTEKTRSGNREANRYIRRHASY